MRRLGVCAALLLFAGAGACGKSCSESKVEPGRDAGVAQAKRGPQGLRFHLSKGEGGGGASERTRHVAGQPLAEAATAALLGRLKPLVEQAGDRQAFALRAGSLPPPLTGVRKLAPWPPPPGPPAPDKGAAGPLKVLRAAPRDGVQLAPHLSVTFSQPMVPVTSQDAAAERVPVKLTPTPKGKWRWVGTRTLLFEPEPRFPMATKYSVEIPAGSASATGGKLAVAERWSFSTPAPRLVARHPSGGPQVLDPLIVLGFDQRVDAKAVLARVRLAGGTAVAQLRRVSRAELAGDEQAEQTLRSVLGDEPDDERVVLLRPRARLAAGTEYELRVREGLASAEGPLTTTEPQSFTFRTYDPLQVEEHACKYNEECAPTRSLWVRFNNPLDEERFDPAAIKVKPEIPDLEVSANGRWLYLRGRTKGRTTYHVVLPAGLTDEFGQTLGSSQVLSFHMGPATPRLISSGGLLRVLDPRGPRKLRFSSVGHREVDLRVTEVGPGDWNAFKDFVRRGLRAETPARPPGRPRVSRVLKIGGDPEAIVDTEVDLQRVLRGGKGHAVVLITQRPFPVKPYERQYIVAWVQATDLGLDAFVDGEQLLGWVTRLEDGQPVSGAQVQLVPAAGAAVSSDGDGLARVPLPAQGGAERVLVARARGDLAMLPESVWGWRSDSSWVRRQPPAETVSWYVFDDRKLYRPQEEVRIKGWARLVDMGRTSMIRLLPETVRSVRYRVLEPRGNEIAKGQAPLGPLGGFAFAFSIPDAANLGHAQVQLEVEDVPGPGRTHRHYFRIAEFRRPEFEVDAAASEGPHFVGGSAELTLDARYYSGGPLVGADVSWYVTSGAGSFAPPQHGDYTFVGWRPSWWSFGDEQQAAPQSERFSGRTDGKGRDRLRVHFDALDPPRPAVLNASATVQDVNRQTWTASASLVVHPARAYVGLKTERYFVERGKPLEVAAVVADLDGKRLVGRPVKLRFVRLHQRYDRGRWRTEELDEQRCQVTSAAEPVKCTFQTHKGGTHLVSATVQDAQGRTSSTEMTRWVTGGEPRGPQRVDQQLVRLIADREQYAPGDTAEILVQAPFADAEGLLTVRRAGIRRVTRFRCRGSSATLRVPITEDHYPGAHVNVQLVGRAPRTGPDGEPVAGAPPRPAFASGALTLAVPPEQRRLSLDVRPAAPFVAPGSQTELAVVVRDAAGRPLAGAEVALVAVDEAVLALTGYKLGDPLTTFHPPRGAGVIDHHLRRWIELADLAELKIRGPSTGKDKEKAEEGKLGGGAARDEAPRAPPAPGATRAPAADTAVATEAPARAKRAAGRGGKAAPAPIAARTDFRPLALFEPALRTDEQGRVSARFKLPDTLTRYRLMAVAAAGALQYGLGESALTAGLPLAVRPSPPRFLNFGDRAEIPVVLQNRAAKPATVRVALRGTQIKLLAAAGREVTVPAEDRVELRFAAEAIGAGTARFQVAVASGDFADAAEFALPVWTPATTEAFATYGTIDEGLTVQPVQVPPGAVPGFGGLEVSTSSTALQALTDAVVYLVAYPFECAEQISSRVLAVAALRDVLAAFSAPGLPQTAEINAAVLRDLERLRGLQNGDGGFGLWRRDAPSWPFVSLHVTHALLRARAKGYPVHEQTLGRALGYARRVESHIPSSYSREVRQAIVAYSLYLRDLGGEADVPRARQLLAELSAGGKEPPLEAVAWLYPVFAGQREAAQEVAGIRKLLANRVSETAATAQFTTSYGDGAYLLMHSSRRVDALLLEGLIEDQPRSDLIVKLVRGLLGHRKQGRWSSTQENAWVLLALDRYFRRYEKVTPSFVARAWLGPRFAGQHAFRGRSTEQQELRVPLPELAEVAGQSAVTDLVLAKQGPGRLYYRIGLRYAPASLKLDPASHGFTVRRSYEALDEGDDVRRGADGVWRVKAGARVRVKLTLVVPARRYHVALVDPLPAGLEAIDADLRGAQGDPGATPSAGKPRRGGAGRMGAWSRWWWRPYWYEHHNLRDERAEAFASLLFAGVYEYEYTARATTPGTFVVPPPRAEEMYHPETFGRGGTDRLVVK